MLERPTEPSARFPAGATTERGVEGASSETEEIELRIAGSQGCWTGKVQALVLALTEQVVSIVRLLDRSIPEGHRPMLSHTTELLETLVDAATTATCRRDPIASDSRHYRARCRFRAREGRGS